MRLQQWWNGVLRVGWRPGTERMGATGSREAVQRSLPLGMFGYATSWRVLLLFALLFVGKPQSAPAQAVRTNRGFEANSLPRNDDGSSSSAVPLGFTVNFFGVSFSSAFVNNNGNITFGGGLSEFTPAGLVASPLRIIAPFWADVDTRGARSSLVTYGQDTVNGRPAFGVNYVNVGYYGSHDDKLNSFQLVLIDRTDLGEGNFDIEFNYDRIVWETGDASGGAGGLGGTSASAGYSNGSQTADGSFEILGSRRRGIFLDSNRNGLKYRRLNSNLRGRVVFFVRSGSVECSFASLSIDEEFPWPGGAGSVQVAAPSGCEWTATSNASFVSITSGSTNSGNGIVDYVVAPNRSRRPRSGTMTVAGTIVTVTQEGFVTLRVSPPTVSLSSVDGAFPSRVALRIESIRQPVSWAASATLLNGESWRLRVTPSSGTATGSEPSVVTLELNGSFLPPLPGEVYEAMITVRDTIEGPAVEVPVILVVSPPGGGLVLSQSAFVFRVSEGGTVPASQTLRLLNSGEGSVGWSIPASALNTASWLNLSSLLGVAVTGSTTPSSTALAVNPAGLAPGVYQTLLPVFAAGGTNEPQLVSVTLHVVPAATPPGAETSPGAMVFVAQQGGSRPAAQNLTVSNLGAGELTFQLAPSTASGGGWLDLSATSGSTGSGPVTLQVTANPADLPAGIYRGGISATFSAGGAQDVPVLLVVAPPGQRTLFGTTVCSPQGMDLVATTVENGASLPVSFPLPLLVQAVDTCGEPVNNATVLVSVEGKRTVLRAVGRGLYSGMWTPELIAGSVPLNITALHPAYGTFERIFRVLTAEAPGGVSLPSIAMDGVVDSAGFTQGLPLAPGSMISVFGSQFAQEETFSSTVPLPRRLGGISVQIGSEDVPLYYVAPGQINAQVPFTARPGQSVSLVVKAGGQLTAPQNYLIAPVQPNIFESGGFAFALDRQGLPITSQNPARIGDTLQIFATGLGLVEPAVATGVASPPSSTVGNRVTVTIGGVEVPVSSQGLAPGLVGLYQVNVSLPPTVTPGEDVIVLIKQKGIPSNPNSPVSIPVRLR